MIPQSVGPFRALQSLPDLSPSQPQGHWSQAQLNVFLFCETGVAGRRRDQISEKGKLAADNSVLSISSCSGRWWFPLFKAMCKGRRKS